MVVRKRAVDGARIKAEGHVANGRMSFRLSDSGSRCHFGLGLTWQDGLFPRYAPILGPFYPPHFLAFLIPFLFCFPFFYIPISCKVLALKS